MKTLLLIFLLTISLFASEGQKNIKKPSYVVDAKHFNMIDATKAFYISGGRQHGIMKKNFAFAYEEDAKEYVKKNGGRIVDYKTNLELEKKKFD